MEKEEVGEGGGDVRGGTDEGAEAVLDEGGSERVERDEEVATGCSAPAYGRRSGSRSSGSGKD